MVRVLVALLALAVSAVPQAQAQAEGQTSFVLEAHMDGEGTYWTLEGDTRKAPTLVVPAGAKITVTVKNMDDAVHNIQVDGQPASDYVEATGDTVVYEFTAPASGSKDYWCVPHKSSGMVGVVQVAGSAPADESGQDTPGLGALAVVVAGSVAAWVASRRR